MFSKCYQDVCYFKAKTKFEYCFILRRNGFLRGDHTTKLLHETKLETAFHKLFGEIFGQDLLK